MPPKVAKQVVNAVSRLYKCHTLPVHQVAHKCNSTVAYGMKTIVNAPIKSDGSDLFAEGNKDADASFPQHIFGVGAGTVTPVPPELFGWDSGRG